MNTLRLFRSFPLSVRLLLVNQLAGNTGFYMLMPFLAGYLLTDLRLSATVVGVVLGVRNLSQQGLFLVGGAISDRLGARGVIIVGAAIRALGFALFAVGGSLAVVLLASVLTGFAGALFNPAVRAYIARDSAERAASAFALFNVFGNVGSALGPLAGTVLVAMGFQLTAAASAAIFAALTLAQLALLPARPVPRAAHGVGRDLLNLFSHRVFWGFALALAGMFALQAQSYFTLTLQAQEVAGAHGTAAVASLFLVDTVVILLLQVRLTQRFARGERGPAMALGMAVMGCAFVIPPLVSPVLDASGGGVLAVAVRLLPILAAVVVLTVGVMIVQPFVNELIAVFGGERLTGTYFGAFYLVSGVLTVCLTAVAGAAVEYGGGPLSWWPAALCAATGFLSAGAVTVLYRTGRLPPATAETPTGTTVSAAAAQPAPDTESRDPR
ncbi:MFS transporter [Nocardia huaxiensis]|uniref:MFS transporter n=1 Tax=Nocardia huaxiensis TaxID=2755382 RepID=UPI001E54AABF|nr:MFS transporter [Nocardia huaxiensis]UFS98489.1 MFS transporter [Nocardia huaxiensis]